MQIHIQVSVTGLLLWNRFLLLYVLYHMEQNSETVRNAQWKANPLHICFKIILFHPLKEIFIAVCFSLIMDQLYSPLLEMSELQNPGTTWMLFFPWKHSVAMYSPTTIFSNDFLTVPEIITSKKKIWIKIVLERLFGFELITFFPIPGPWLTDCTGNVCHLHR